MFSSHKYIFYVYSLTNLVIKYFTHLQVVRSVPPLSTNGTYMKICQKLSNKSSIHIGKLTAFTT